MGLLWAPAHVPRWREREKHTFAVVLDAFTRLDLDSPPAMLASFADRLVFLFLGGGRLSMLDDMFGVEYSKKN